MKVEVKVDTIVPKTYSEADARRKKMTLFIAANLLSVAICVAIFWGVMAVPEASPVDDAFHSIWGFLRRHETVAVLAASLPFFASLLVGQFEARKARARRMRVEAEQKRERIERERLEQQAARATQAAANH